LYVALLEVLRRQGFATAFAVIALPNAASVACHESLGFAKVGVCRRVGFKQGRWHDVGWWQVDLDPRDRPPARSPSAVGPMRSTPAWAEALAAGERLLRTGA
jgi:phosphinothricin acetyltransferase